MARFGGPFSVGGFESAVRGVNVQTRGSGEAKLGDWEPDDPRGRSNRDEEILRRLLNLSLLQVFFRSQLPFRCRVRG